MNEVRTLLEQFWISRETDKETYFRVKRDIPRFRKFLQEQLSDKVQFCDGKTAVMENAERREARLEKEKAAEKATGRTEAKGGIHGKLEKAKAEIKAKGTDTIPKNRAKDLASVL